MHFHEFFSTKEFSQFLSLKFLLLISVTKVAGQTSEYVNSMIEAHSPNV